MLGSPYYIKEAVMSRCHGCGGVLGRDCFNEAECMWIMNDMRMHYEQPHQSNLCQGCSMITDRMVECFNLCPGLSSDEDVELRRQAFNAIKNIYSKERNGAGR